jgi:PEGA domain-containing protein
MRWLLSTATAVTEKSIALSWENTWYSARRPSLPEARTEQAPSAIDSENSSVTIKSAPDGAEIPIDGKFAGSAPSTLRLKFGEHRISIKQAGYVLWERTMTLSAGENITVNATLEKVP